MRGSPAAWNSVRPSATSLERVDCGEIAIVAAGRATPRASFLAFASRVGCAAAWAPPASASTEISRPKCDHTYASPAPSSTAMEDGPDATDQRPRSERPSGASSAPISITLSIPRQATSTDPRPGNAAAARGSTQGAVSLTRGICVGIVLVPLAACTASRTRSTAFSVATSSEISAASPSGDIASPTGSAAVSSSPTFRSPAPASAPASRISTRPRSRSAVGRR